MVIDTILLSHDSGKITLYARVQFAGQKPQTLYFSTDKKNESTFVADASPFLAAILLPCMKTHEDIFVDGTVSTQLLQNIKKIMVLVESWDIGLQTVSISVKKTTKDTGHPARTATFFSAGVDSFYTYLKHPSARSGQVTITDFILVHGFDILLENRDFFHEVRTTVEKVAREEKVNLLVVETNIADIVERKLVWDLAHGGALAAVGLFLRKSIHTLYLPGSVRNDRLFPYGTHPDLDNLWSTESLHSIHDGEEYDRLEKIMHVVSKSDLALKYLRVCTQNLKGKYNCSRCYKCLTTMIELICADVFEKATTFEHPIDLEAVRQMYYDYDAQYNTYGESALAVLRQQHRESVLQEAIAYSLAQSKKQKLSRKIFKSIAYFDQQYNRRRLYRFVFRLTGKQDRNILFKFLSKKRILK